MENRECIYCKQPIKLAWLNTGAGVFVLEQPIKGLKRKACFNLMYYKLTLF